MEHVALCEFEDAPDDGSKPKRDTQGITLSTIHGAKGLEWPVVFIVRCNEDTIPLNASMGDDELSQSLMQEERRLLYVAMTRARSNLFISYLMLGPDKQPVAVSSFLQDVPSEYRLNMQHLNVEHADLHFGVPSVEHRVPSRSQLKPISMNSQLAANVPDAIGEQLRYWQQVRQEPPLQSARKRKPAPHSATRGKQHLTARRPRKSSGTVRTGRELALLQDGNRARSVPTGAQKRSAGRQRVVVSDEEDFA
jgi:ATP-dependent exoDNAse (exonuclease V) beta subunit